MTCLYYFLRWEGVMFFILRLVAVFIIGGIICILGTVYCLFNPRNPKNVSRFAYLFGACLNPFFGIKIITREHSSIKRLGCCIFIANHQNNYDVLIASKIVQPKTVTVGKKSLVWMPLFGPLYYLSGNILLDRNNKLKARDTIERVVKEIKEKKISVWMFPEGTRSRGKGLLPFKTGAFRAAIEAGVPVVPICISNTNGIRLNRWNNGYMIVEMLEPIKTRGMSKDKVRELMERCHHLMSAKIDELNHEVKLLEKK